MHDEKMKIHTPKMILFDYGQTLVTETEYDPLAGIAAILKHSENPNGATPRQICALGDQLNAETNRFPENPWEMTLELAAIPFERYLYDWFGVRFLLPRRQIEKLYWDAAAPGAAAPFVEQALSALEGAGIRCGVVSNLAYSGETLEERLRECIPDSRFSFVMASSGYLFRKPHPRLFQIALRKAGLSPQEVWFCGDNAVCDVEGPYQAGMTGVWYKGALRRTQPPACPHLELESWLDLAELIQL